MRLSDDYDKNNESRTGLAVIYMTVGVLAFFVLVVSVVLILNYSGKRNRTATTAPGQVNSTESGAAQAEASVSEDSVTEELGQSTLTSDDLDFWDMYKEEEEEKAPEVDGKTPGERYAENAEALEKAEEEAAAAEDLSEGGTKTKVILPDGTEQWVMINAYISKNTYDFTSLVLQEPVMRYYENGAKASYMGVDISDEQGTVDFEALKKAGVDFVMIELAARGYSTGNITYDDTYYANLQNATAAGLDVGVIFSSQAATEAEAEEEAQIILDNIGDFAITYPIVFDMELVTNDSSRIQNLTKAQLTAITSAFCKKIAAAGFTPMIYGNKYWLLRKIDLTLLSNYDIWLSQSEDVPDYPYQFAMWQYAQDGAIAGIDGVANLDICFIDYSKK